MASNDMQVLMYKILKYVFRETYFTPPENNVC